MKYVASSQEKPQNFPIFSMHSDMDLFILYNAEMCPKIDGKLLELAQARSINEKSIAQDQQIVEVIDATNKQDIPYQ